MLFLLLLPHAWAHADGRLDGVDLQVMEGGEMAVEASFGFVWAQPDETMSWHCHETITAPDVPITPRYSVSDDGVILGLVPATEQAREEGLALYRSTDGCDWPVVEGLEDITLAQVAFKPGDAQVALLSTATLGEGVANGILRSQDGGQTFSEVLMVESRLFGSVHFSQAGSAWAGASWSGTDQAWVYMSTDGESWSEHEVPLRDLDGRVQTLEVVATSPTDPLTAWLVAGPFGSDVLLRTTDGGESFEQLFHVTGDILDAAVDDAGGVWLAVSGRDFYYAADGEDFAQVTSAPRGVGLGSDGDGIWLTLDAVVSGYLVAQSDDGAFERGLHLSGLELAECPAESHAVQWCDPLWPELAGRLPFPPDEDTGLELGDSGPSAPQADSADSADSVPTRCGCGAKHSAVLALPLILAGLRRRH